MLNPTYTYRNVTIVNNETRTPHEFQLIEERLSELQRLVEAGSPFEIPSWGSGVDSRAAMGMYCIFPSIPPRFPLADILSWLEGEMAKSASQIEIALAQLGVSYGY